MRDGVREWGDWRLTCCVAVMIVEGDTAVRERRVTTPVVVRMFEASDGKDG